MNEWIQCDVTYMEEYYSTIKGIKWWHMLQRGGTWNITLNERCQTKTEKEKKIPHLIWLPSYEISRIGNSIDAESGLVFSSSWVAPALGDREWLLIYMELLSGVMKILQNDIIIRNVQLCLCTKKIKCALYVGEFHDMWIISQQNWLKDNS